MTCDLCRQGDRLSHAVGCAFAACLERKQKRDKECSVTMAVDPATSSFTRFGSFRQGPITDRLNDPQEGKPAGQARHRAGGGGQGVGGRERGEDWRRGFREEQGQGSKLGIRYKGGSDVGWGPGHEVR